MTEWHPDLDSLARFLDGDLPAAESAALQRHLSSCPACESQFLQLLPLPQAATADAGDAGAVPAPARPGYRNLIRRVLDESRCEIGQRRSLLESERQLAAGLWAELRPLDPEQRRALLLGEERFQSWGLFELMLDKARQMALAKPRQAEPLLRLVLELIDLLDPGRYGAPAIASARARGWIHLGNTWRILSDFRCAEQAFETAEGHLSHSWLDPLDEALLLTHRASLRKSQRRLDEAHRLLDEALALYREVNEPHLQGRTLMKKATVFHAMGEYGEAITCLRNCLFLLDGHQEPRLLVAAQANLILYLHESGQTRAAAALIPEARQLLYANGQRSDLLRLRWIEGRILAALPQAAEAEEALLEAREGFIEDRAVFDAALVSLDLAALYARQGRTAAVSGLVAEMLPIFRACDVSREAIAALIVLEGAAEREQMTVGLVEEVAGFLKQVRSNPALRFRDPDPGSSRS